MVHLPIGVLMVALLLQWLSQKEKYAVAHGVLKIIWLLGVLSSLVACITGYLLSVSDEYEDNLVSLHMWMGIGVTIVALFITAKVISRQYDVQYKVASIVLFALIILTGHFGGSLTHGAGYLTGALNQTPEAEIVQKSIPNIQEAQVYADVVQPVLQTRCYNCHGPNKQKGKLRMDDSLHLMKGGKDGAVIMTGQAEESEMIKRLLLPREDEHHMPPKQKPQLTDQQIALLHWWIEQGAPFNSKVKDLQQPEKIKPLLLSLQSGAEKKAALSSVPAAPVEKADEKALLALKEKNVVVMPVAQNSNYLMANFVTADRVADKDLELLLPIKKQLVWLKLGYTGITDNALPIIGQCQNLTSLHLNNTRISDNGLPALRSLNHLQTLNLVGTQVSAAGLLPLQSLQQLQAIYVYQTNVAAKDWETLAKAFPKTAIDTGGYKLPHLASDTTELQYNE